MSCGLDPVLLWLWCGLAAVVLIRPLGWGPPYAVGVAIKKKKKGRRKNSIYMLMEMIQREGKIDDTREKPQLRKEAGDVKFRSGRDAGATSEPNIQS